MNTKCKIELICENENDPSRTRTHDLLIGTRGPSCAFVQNLEVVGSSPTLLLKNEKANLALSIAWMMIRKRVKTFELLGREEHKSFQAFDVSKEVLLLVVMKRSDVAGQAN